VSAEGSSAPHSATNPVVARWEWRAFGESFGAAEALLTPLGPQRVEESDELYLLSSRSDASVKIREGLVDVKLLQAVDEGGLEQWMPVLKAPEPLSAAEVVEVMGALGTEAPALAHTAYTFGELLAELIDPNPDLLGVAVQKRRDHYTVGGCLAELTEVRTEHGARRTVAVESEHPALVRAAVCELGLAARRNVSLPRGLKALAGFGAKRFAVIDVGTNSVKFHLGERAADGEWQTLVDRAELTRLGEGLDETGELQDGPIERTVAAIAGMADEAARNGVEALAAVGTAGLRLAPNRGLFLEAVHERAGIEVEVITGEEEGRLAYLAVKSGLGLGHGSLVVFDTGGGSSQFTLGQGERVDERFSLNVGATRFTERYGLDGVVSDDRLAAATAAIAADLARLDGRGAPDTLVGLGGTITNLAAVSHGLRAYDPAVVDGSILALAEVERQIELYRTRTSEQRRGLAGLQPERAGVILAGACIVRTVISKLGRDSLTVSDHGLRHGLLVERFGGAERAGAC
jgi:exopolyphosphatase / guanosine-5'-triphosphate,3'-diphosphate pyrophosphatase